MNIFKLFFMSFLTLVLLPLMLVGGHKDLRRLIDVLAYHWKIKLNLSDNKQENETVRKRVSFRWIANAINASFISMRNTFNFLTRTIFSFGFLCVIIVLLVSYGIIQYISEQRAVMIEKNLLANVVYSSLVDIRETVSTNGVESVNLNKINTLVDDNKIDIKLKKEDKGVISITLSMKIPNASTCKELTGLETKEYIMSVRINDKVVTSKEDYGLLCVDDLTATVLFLQ